MTMKDDEDFFTADSTTDAADAALSIPGLDGMPPGGSLDLTEDSFAEYPDIPMGTWMRVKVYEVKPGHVQSGDNYGKPKYQLTFRTVGEDIEKWGGTSEGRAFTEFANLFTAKNGWFPARDVLKGLGFSPKRGQKVMAFAKEAADQLPQELHGFCRADVEKVDTNLVYVMPAPQDILNKELYVKVGGYRASGEKKLFASPAEAMKAGYDRSYVSLTEFKSVEDFNGQESAQKQSMSIFKG